MSHLDEQFDALNHHVYVSTTSSAATTVDMARVSIRFGVACRLLMSIHTAATETTIEAPVNTILANMVQVFHIRKLVFPAPSSGTAGSGHAQSQYTLE